jgi:hypothetical protein
MDNPNSPSYYRIPEIKLNSAKKNLDRLIRRAEKLGVESCSYTVGESFDVPFIHYYTEEGRLRSCRFCGTAEELVKMEDAGKVKYRRFVEISISGPKPVLDGWEFVATLQHLCDDQGVAVNILRVRPDFNAKLPEKFKNVESYNCDHCHQIRARNDTYVVHNSTSSEWKQIGSSCLKDFTGGNDPRQILFVLEFFLEAESELNENFDEDDFGSDGNMGLHWALREFLATTAAVIRQEGWMSKSKAGETGKVPTATLVEMALENKRKAG